MKNVFFFLAFLLFGGVLSAQRTEGPKPDRGQPRIEKMAAELNLSDDQLQQIEQIQANAKKQQEALRNANLSEDEMRSKQRDLGKQTRNSINTVLTEEQQAKMRELRGDKRGRQGAKLSPETRSKVQAYKEANVKPTMQGARRELERRISPADRQEIARLREVMDTNPAVAKHKKKAEKGVEKRALTPADRDAMKAQVAQWKEEHVADLTSLNSLTDKYSDDMIELMKQLEEEQATWKADLEKITAEDRASQATTTPRGPRHGKSMDKRQEKGGKDSKKMSRFLLMNLEG